MQFKVIDKHLIFVSVLLIFALTIVFCVGKFVFMFVNWFVCLQSNVHYIYIVWYVTDSCFFQ